MFTLMICSSAIACSCFTVPAGTEAVSVVTVDVVAMHVLMPGIGTGAVKVHGSIKQQPQLITRKHDAIVAVGSQ